MHGLRARVRRPGLISIDKRLSLPMPNEMEPIAIGARWRKEDGKRKMLLRMRRKRRKRKMRGGD